MSTATILARRGTRVAMIKLGCRGGEFGDWLRQKPDMKLTPTEFLHSLLDWLHRRAPLGAPGDLAATAQRRVFSLTLPEQALVKSQAARQAQICELVARMEDALGQVTPGHDYLAPCRDEVLLVDLDMRKAYHNGRLALSGGRYQKQGETCSTT